MGLGFRKNVNIIPGVKLNLSRSGHSISLNSKGMKYNISSRGTRITYSIFGTVIKKIFWEMEIRQYGVYKGAKNKIRTISI